MESLTEYLTGSKTSNEEKCLELLKYFYAGFLTISEYHRLIEIHGLGDINTMAEVERRLGQNKNFLPVAPENYETVLSGTKNRKFIFDVDEAKELVSGKNYFDIWKLKLDKPEGFGVIYNSEELESEGPLYTVNGFEEYGLIKINKYLVSRSCKKYVLSDKPLKDTEKVCSTIEDVVFVFQDMTERELGERYNAITSMDGGFGFTAVCQLVSLLDNIRTQYHCPARYAFLVKDVPVKEPLFEQTPI